MRIDFHTHTFPARIAAPAIKKMQASSHAAASLDGTGPALTASLQKAGLDCAVVLPVATNPAKVQSMNDLSLRLTGHDGLLFFGCIHPDQRIGGRSWTGSPQQACGASSSTLSTRAWILTMCAICAFWSGPESWG